MLRKLSIGTKNQTILGAAFAAALLTMPAHANVLTNGSFETDVITFPFYENYGPGCSGNCGTSITGWTVTTNNVDLVSTIGGWPAPAYDGKQYLDLVGYGSTGGVSQTFNTVSGQHYNISFAYGNNPGSTSFASAYVKVAGLNTLFSADFSTTANIGWRIFADSFLADSTSTTLYFNEFDGSNNGGVLLDAVNIAPTDVTNVGNTPLPATWMMLLGGILAFAPFVYRRSNRHARALASV